MATKTKQTRKAEEKPALQQTRPVRRRPPQPAVGADPVGAAPVGDQAWVDAPERQAPPAVPSDAPKAAPLVPDTDDLEDDFDLEAVASAIEMERPLGLQPLDGDYALFALSGSLAKQSAVEMPMRHNAAALAQEKFNSITTPDKATEIRIEPLPEEQRAFDYIMSHLPAGFTPLERDSIMKAYVIASYAHRNQKRESGEPYMLHPLAVATILLDLHMDAETLTAALLHDVAEDTEFDIKYLREQFDAVVVTLVDGVTKLKRINQISTASQNLADAKQESLRKMFLAMVDDVRVVLIKLADRLHNMRTLGSQPKHKRKRIARETMDIFAPLANRLGIRQVKWELEDLSFRYLQPEMYRELAKAMQQKRSDREKYIIKTKHELERALADAGIPAEVSGRPKHIYSVWKKMQRKGVDFEQIYDIHGFRIIVESDAHCYGALGVVHSLWRPIPGEFDDYIANPKDNMYRSLHTAVLSRRSGRPMEVQIRTPEMHEVAELGIAAHWRYKEHRRHDQGYQAKINWLRQLMEWRQDVTDADDFMEGMKTDVFKDRVYVFTPKGEPYDLPAGATPIDLAYAIHTELGHRCRGANVNGRLVPLDYKLKTGDQVTILTAKRGGPSRDWLNPNLEYVATQRARSKIRGWLRKQNREENIMRGRQLLEKELRRLSVTLSYETVMRLFPSYDKLDDFLAAIGYGDINSQQIATKVLENERREQQQVALENGLRFDTYEARPRSTGGGLQVQGVEGLLVNMARCCNPVPGDPIIGYVTRGRGITVHRSNCPNILDKVRRTQGKQVIEVQWMTKVEDVYPVNIEISAYDRSGLMRDIAALVADEEINMLSVEALTGQKDNMAQINATLEIRSLNQLSRILTKIDRLANVTKVHRRLGRL